MKNRCLLKATETARHFSIRDDNYARGPLPCIKLGNLSNGSLSRKAESVTLPPSNAIQNHCLQLA